MKLKLYVAGPMTGYPGFNIAKFDAMTETLRSLGHEVVSPVELDDPATRAISAASPDGNINTLVTHGYTWGDFLARDVKLLADGGFDGIVVLDGWQYSRGARLETFVGKMLVGIQVYRLTRNGLERLRLLELAKAWLSKNDISFQSPASEDVSYASML